MTSRPDLENLRVHADAHDDMCGSYGTLVWPGSDLDEDNDAVNVFRCVRSVLSARRSTRGGR